MTLKSWLFLLSAVLMTCAAGSAFADPFQITYLGSVAPTSPGSCGVWNGTPFSWSPYTEGGGAFADMGSVVSDPAAIDGMAYRVNANTPGAMCVFKSTPFKQGGTNSQFNIDGAIGATIVARVKVASDAGSGLNIGFAESAEGLQSGFHFGGANGNATETQHGGTATISSDGNYHVIRMAASGYRGNPCPWTDNFNDKIPGALVGQGFEGAAAATDIAVIASTGSTTATPLREIKIIGGGAGGGANPNASLPLNFIQFGPDASNVITVSVDFRPGATTGAFPEPTFMWEFRISDTRGGSLGYWYGKNTTCRGRTDVGALVTDEFWFTDTNWHTLTAKIHVDTRLTDFYCDGNLLGTLTHQSNGISLGQISFTRKANSNAADHTAFFDNVLVNGVFLSQRRMKLYIDENPNPVVTETGVSSVGSPLDSFLMGVGAGQQDIYFDWITATNAGAFAPGQEMATIGHSLVIDPAPVTTVGGARNATSDKEVCLRDLLVTGVYYDYDSLGNQGTVGFAVQPVDRAANGMGGIRVVANNPDVHFGEHLASVIGTVVAEGGEPVLHASYVEQGESIEALPASYTMSNRAAAGVVMPSSLSDAFTYPNGPVAGNGAWLGPLSQMLAVNNGTLKVCGGWQPAESVIITPTITNSDSTIKIKVKQGVGYDGYWDIYIKNGSGYELAHWYGSGMFLRGKVDNTPTPTTLNLTGGWDELKVVTAAETSTLYLNGVAQGTYTHGYGGSGVASIQIGRGLQNAQGNTGDYVSFDDLSVTATTSGGMNTLGVFTTIYGIMTRAKHNPPYTWDGGFWIDDGCGLYDGNSLGATGIFCRLASCMDSGNFYSGPYEADWVSVTGTMGVKKIDGRLAPYFWTWDYHTFY